MQAVLRQIRISPKKANLVAGLVRKKKVDEALTLLKFTQKKAAKILYKVIKSAQANAENNFKQPKDLLVIDQIIVTEGPTYKRINPVSRGRAHPILKRTSHITVKIGVDTAAKKATPKKKEEAPKKAEETKAEEKKPEEAAEKKADKK